MRFSAILLLLLAAASPVAAQDRMQVPPPGLPSLPADGPMRFMLHRSAAMPAMLTITASADVARAPDQLRMTAGVLTAAATAATVRHPRPERPAARSVGRTGDGKVMTGWRSARTLGIFSKRSHAASNLATAAA